MFNTDKPINYIVEDKLGRSAFARRLAKTIVQFDTKENYAIALQGKWGCGKTSVVNMALEEIDNLGNLDESKRNIIVIKFNPWNFTDSNQLINQFFLTIANSLKVDNNNEKLKNIGSAIEKYSAALEYSEYIPVIGKYLKLVPSLFGKYGKSIKEKAERRENDVSYRKSMVEEALNSLSDRLLIVIDDIDRLPNSQIQLIFQLVNLVAGFPNVTYLLSYDKDVVVRALSNVQQYKGEEYLEKIIQVPFDVPQVSISRINNILFTKLDDLIGIYNNIEFDSSRWSKVFENCISPFIKTLRDVNRYYNTLSFSYPTVEEEVDFIDMAGICALQVFAPPIHEWIMDNKYSLVGGSESRGMSHKDIENNKREKLLEFKEIYSENPLIMLNALMSLFPKFSNTVSFSGLVISTSEIHQDMRIASDSKFDVFFSLSMDNVKISRKELDASLMTMGEDELRNYVNLLSDRDLLPLYYAEIRHYIKKIPESRIELLLTVFVSQSYDNMINKPQVIGVGSNNMNAYMVSDILFRIGDQEIRYEILSRLLSNANITTFQNLLHLLHIIELSHGRIGDTSRAHDSKLVSEEGLHALEEIFLNKVNGFISTSNIFEWKELRRVLMLWKFIGEDSYSEYIQKEVGNGLNGIIFASLDVSIWSSNGIRSEFELDKSEYMNYISKEQLKSSIRRNRLTDDFWLLDEEIIECVAALSVSYDSTDVMRFVGINEIKDKIEEWKSEYYSRRQ